MLDESVIWLPFYSDIHKFLSVISTRIHVRMTLRTQCTAGVLHSSSPDPDLGAALLSVSQHSHPRSGGSLPQAPLKEGQSEPQALMR
jgi:hypothetical protein